MDIKSIKKKISDGISSAKDSLPQIDTDNIRKQIGDNLNRAKESLTPDIDIDEIKKNVSQGLKEMKTKADKTVNTAHEELAVALDNVQATADNIGNSMADFGSKVIANITDFAKYFSESDLWKKLGGFATKAGAKLVFIVLSLFYSLDSMTIKNKLIVMGALGYFIFPADTIPDIIPVAGFTDDLTAMMAIFGYMRKSITSATVGKAQDKLTEWFGDIDNSELPDLMAISDKDVKDTVRLIDKTKSNGLKKTGMSLLNKKLKNI